MFSKESGGRKSVVKVAGDVEEVVVVEEEVAEEEASRGGSRSEALSSAVLKESA